MNIFYFVREWCLKKVFGEKFDLLYIFIMGGVGIGKSYIIKVMYYEVFYIFV